MPFHIMETKLNLHSGFIFEWETELVELHDWASLGTWNLEDLWKLLPELFHVSKCPQQQYQICIDVSHKQADSVKDRPRSGHPQT